MSDHPSTRPRPPSWHALRWPLVVVAVVLIAVLGSLRACHTVGEEQRASLDQVGRAAADLAERFSTGRITTTFVASIPELVGAGETRLELAAYQAVETFSRSDDRRVLFDLIPLGTTVTEIRVPVTYRYHVRLEDEWNLRVVDRVCLVVAPPIRPTLPPAIHTDRMEKHSDRGWLRFDTDEQMDALERTMTPTLSARAADPRHLELVRETCRRRVAEFVRGWLLHEDHWRQDRFLAVTVVFADEAPGTAPPGPTVTLEGG
jgi:hypothetical protein